MNIKMQLLEEHSKDNATKIAAYIGTDHNKFAELIRLFLFGDYRVTQRAARVLSIVCDHSPDLIRPHIKEIVFNLQNDVADAVKRNTLRILQNIEVSEELAGVLVDRCFHYLNDAKEPVAVKVFAMTVLYNIANKEPELKRELKIIIEDQLLYAKPAFISRAKRLLRLLESAK